MDRTQHNLVWQLIWNWLFRSRANPL